MTLEDLMRDALHVQDACNLSGIVLTWGKAIVRLRELEPNKGTDWYNQHPVNVLYASKVADLTGAAVNFGTAYREVLTATAETR